MKILKCDKCGKQFKRITSVLEDDIYGCLIVERKKDGGVTDKRLHQRIRDFVYKLIYLCPRCKEKLVEQLYLMLEFLATKEEK